MPYTLMAGLALILGGCSIQGTYPDAGEPDAAKLRFITALDSATLDIIEPEHCAGRTTGLLNNPYTTRSSRRADMSIAAPAEAQDYLEIRLTPGREVLLRTRTLVGSATCTNTFNFTPQSGSEYELVFTYADRFCHTALMRLNQVDGRVARSPVPLPVKGLPGCAGSDTIFRPSAKALPDTPERLALMERIIDGSVTEAMKPSSLPVENPALDKDLDTLVKDREKSLGFTLPAAYWTQYRQNMDRFTADLKTGKARALQLYKEDYRTRLQQLDTDRVKELVPDSAEANLLRIAQLDKTMRENYLAFTRRVFQDDSNHHLTRMAELDRRYGVCERYAECWKN